MMLCQKCDWIISSKNINLTDQNVKNAVNSYEVILPMEFWKITSSKPMADTYELKVFKTLLTWLTSKHPLGFGVLEENHIGSFDKVIHHLFLIHFGILKKWF